MLQFKGLTCCAFQEISGIEEVNDPKESILQLCRHVWPERRIDYGDKVHPSAFYLIHGVVRVDEDDEDCYDEDEIGAVERLAKFIRKNNLGTIIAGPTRTNRVNEPGHSVRGYIWAPSEDNLWEWWEQNRSKKDAKAHAESVKEARIDGAIYGSYRC